MKNLPGPDLLRNMESVMNNSTGWDGGSYACYDHDRITKYIEARRKEIARKSVGKLKRESNLKRRREYPAK